MEKGEVVYQMVFQRTMFIEYLTRSLIILLIYRLDYLFATCARLILVSMPFR